MGIFIHMYPDAIIIVLPGLVIDVSPFTEIYVARLEKLYRLTPYLSIEKRENDNKFHVVYCVFKS